MRPVATSNPVAGRLVKSGSLCNENDLIYQLKVGEILQQQKVIDLI